MTKHEYRGLTLAVAVEELDRRLAYSRNAMYAIDDLASLIHDGLTGKNDLWLKTQLLDALAGVELNVRATLPDRYADWELELMEEKP